MKTRTEVEALKQNWLADPCYDLDDVPGFEEFADELRQFQREHKERWVRDRDARLGKKAEEIGCPGNLTLAAYVERLEGRIAALEEHLDWGTR